MTAARAGREKGNRYYLGIATSNCEREAHWNASCCTLTNGDDPEGAVRPRLQARRGSCEWTKTERRRSSESRVKLGPVQR